MSYEKLGFTSGQTLKAEHLNHMEDGIANAGGDIVIVSMSAESGMLNHTPAEILDMTNAGKMVLCNATGTRFECTIDVNEEIIATSSLIQALDDTVVLARLNFDANGMFVGADNYLLTATKM